MTIFRYRRDWLSRLLRATLVLYISFSAVGPMRGDDWPMLAHDSFHSNQTAEQLPVSELRLAWTYRSPQPPQPAWAGPAKWDAYSHLRGLRSMRQYDPVFHTTLPYLGVGGRQWFNIRLQKKGEQGDASRAQPFRRPGVVEFNCDVHKWMKGYTVVHTNPYVAVSDAQGKIALDEIPPGEHPYVAWHEQLGEKRGTVKIEADKVVTLKLEFELAQ